MVCFNFFSVVRAPLQTEARGDSGEEVATERKTIAEILNTFLKPC